MINAAKEEITRLVGNSRKVGYSEIDDLYSNSYESDDAESNKKEKHGYDSSRLPLGLHGFFRLSRRWKLVGIAFIALCVGVLAGSFLSLPRWTNLFQTTPKTSHKCRFCNQAPPTVHHDQSYTIPDINSNSIVGKEQEEEPILVTPMTISYEYELYDGEMIFTNSHAELIPNLDYDYAVLGVSSLRNVNRATGMPVSLDEVYVHHFTIFPINMLGAEVLSREKTPSDPYMKFPDGYALHVRSNENPYLRTNAHLLSNKNLLPIRGSLALARKECNECYYAPGKGSECTPEVSGTFLCCGDSDACTQEGAECACAVSPGEPREPRDALSPNGVRRTRHEDTKKRRTTQYRLELDLLISRDVDKFQRVDQWNFAAPSCSINIHGDPVLEEYPPDNFCAKIHRSKTKNKTTDHHHPPKESSYSVSPYSALSTGGGSLFHQVPENDEDPYLRTTTHVLAPAGGTLVWAQSHLHTGAVNATLYKNGSPVCRTQAFHGTDPNSSTNARSEQNHIVRISSCYEQIPTVGIAFEAGDIFTTETYYYGGNDDDRFVAIPSGGESTGGGEHKNAMSMFFTGVVLEGNAPFLREDRTSFNLWNDFVPVARLHS